MSGDSTPSDLREFVLAQELRKILVDVGGKQVEVREPNLTIRDTFLKMMQLEADGSTKGDIGRAQCYLAIACTYDPKTGQRVFDSSDESKLMNSPAGGAINDIAQAAMSFMSDAEDKAKN